MIFPQLGCPLNGVMFYLHSGILNLSFYKLVSYEENKVLLNTDSDYLTQLKYALQIRTRRKSVVLSKNTEY
jgi:hypothetical protein